MSKCIPPTPNQILTMINLRLHSAILLTALLCSSVTGHAQTDEPYELVFSDEFSLPDGSQPDSTCWSRSGRSRDVVWSRFVSKSEQTVFIEDGHLVCLCMPNTDCRQDTAAMLSGAVETRGKFSFRYGKVEVRLRTNMHRGNFPAAWMMPSDPKADWPACGEIDIFECIDAEGRAYHTVHSEWANTWGQYDRPPRGGSEALDLDRWHTYGLEWNDTLLVWTVDGKPVFSYRKAHDAAALAKGQWPFDQPFYIILNQSVGNGSWAAPPDRQYTYRTEFDYVRVYSNKDRR